jgi:hypothetical protein
VLAMALVTTYAAWRLSVRERDSWRMHRRLDVRSLGWLWTVGTTGFLWSKLIRADASDFHQMGLSFGVVLLYLLVPDWRLEGQPRDSARREA